ncbi:MAG: PIN domain-containing protein [Chloroflexi bacterium]|nr:PIN domain-containing protein [Chloroflexota bacterium]
MIFLDTSAVYALADRRDPNHEQAVSLFGQALTSMEALLVHSAILIEATALLQRRLGLAAALRFLEQSERFVIHWITDRDHGQAVELLKERGRRGLSLVDCTSFVVMRHYHVNQALAFDGDFQQEGFAPYQGAAS